ncbi:conserved hypothetical protein [Talaromyces stipitatus ATCC 10500]|uniref:Uncharacterized protein n=1 Tax=Talaromyces stipitatus (strain ATCC 10500 / CBS 375.48 / QM 6759 / NRRL 1006) TaxID=441959 RepID=B8MHB8_TALSN|nr:uncharacterized protein TSTA_021540 [Talaromyces stipitatus ATCC 10500]EED17097.1 conserved hypothetical protein [Talaromyces stipitatus ATCC 10500]
MPPAESEGSFRPDNQLFNDSPPTNNPIPVPEPTGKKKKKGKDKNGSKGKDTSAKPIPPMESNDIQFSPPSQSDPSSYPGNVFTPAATNPALSSVSPVLDALGAINHVESDTATRTGAWAKSVPFGKSPPTDLPDPGFSSGSPLSIPTPFERPGFSSHFSSSASPPPTRARPTSTSYGQFGITPSPHRSADLQKRNSMGSHLQTNPPLPHLPQAHFYSAPEIDIPTPNRLAADSQYSFCAWDTISEQSLKSVKMGGRVLVVGTDGGVDVLAVEDQRVRTVGSLTGLNGRVLDAKILSCTSRNDPYASSRPHVAVVLHGPIAHKEDSAETSSAGSEQNEILPGLSVKPSPSDQRPQGKDETVYQTSVDVYSIKTGEHITTLFQSKPVSCFDNYPNLSLLAPAPVGNLRLYATHNYVVVACGVSGEVFIYGVTQSASGYQCLGKTWTSIQTRESRRYSTSSSSTDPDGSQIDGQHGATAVECPIVSVYGRWLAVVPPASAPRAPPSGRVLAHLIHKRISSLDIHTPPPKPAVNCATDLGEGESLFDKVARGVTQELVKGARWMGDQGLQAWNNYWNKDQQSAQNGSSRRSPQFEAQQGAHGLFPPTHGQDTAAVLSSEPDLISIIDLKRMEEGHDLKGSTFATFQPPNGCSFLSFAPNGHILLSASRKGDVQYVWDLMQARNCRSAVFLSDELASNSAATAHVRLVARYSRLTTSNVVDVVWTTPTGERFAMVTRKGTVHVFDVPRPAFQWPPLRRIQSKSKRSQAAEKPSTTPDHEESGSSSPFAAAMKLVGGSTQPIIAAVRGRTPSVGASFSGTSSFGISSAAGIGGKAVAAGLSKSVGAATGTVNTLRHVGENRLHLAGFSRDPVPSRVVWIPSRNESLLGIVDYGLFKLYKIKQHPDKQKGRRHQPVIGAKVLELKLPSYLRNPCGPLQIGLPSDGRIRGSWSLPSHVPHSSSATKMKSQPLSQAEIETNTPYQPFHTDRRVNLSVFIDSTTVSGNPQESWVFGNDIPTQRLYVRPLSQSDDEEDEVMDRLSGAPEMENLIRLGNSTDQVEEVVITTRRKKRNADVPSIASPGDDDGGFFENDCDILDFARDRV